MTIKVWQSEPHDKPPPEPRVPRRAIRRDLVIGRHDSDQEGCLRPGRGDTTVLAIRAISRGPSKNRFAFATGRAGARPAQVSKLTCSVRRNYVLEAPDDR